jgi:hypothetical protein
MANISVGADEPSEAAIAVYQVHRIAASHGLVSSYKNGIAKAG